LFREPSVIYAGRKSTMSYVLAVVTAFTSSDIKEVHLKERERAITAAVDAAEITRRRFMKELDISKITIETEEIPQKEGGTRMVSTIEITLTRR